MKAKLIRIGISLAVFLCALLIPPIPEYVRIGLYLAAYLTVAWPVL